jgi:hypothetical protein
MRIGTWQIGERFRALHITQQECRRASHVEPERIHHPPSEAPRPVAPKEPVLPTQGPHLRVSADDALRTIAPKTVPERLPPNARVTSPRLWPYGSDAALEQHPPPLGTGWRQRASTSLAVGGDCWRPVVARA